MSSRVAERGAFDVPVRVAWLEDDLDRTDRGIEDIRTDMLAGFKKCEADGIAIRRLLTTLLLSVVGFSIALVTNVVVVVLSR